MMTMDWMTLKGDNFGSTRLIAADKGSLHTGRRDLCTKGSHVVIGQAVVEIWSFKFGFAAEWCRRGPPVEVLDRGTVGDGPCGSTNVTINLWNESPCGFVDGFGLLQWRCNVKTDEIYFAPRRRSHTAFILETFSNNLLMMVMLFLVLWVGFCGCMNLAPVVVGGSSLPVYF
jgi:hypothetical protein